MGQPTKLEQTPDLDLGAMRTAIAARAQQAMAQAAEFAREKPHLAVGVALGVGWVLGNGLPPRLMITAARLGWKAFLGSAIAGSGLAGIMREAAGVDASVSSARTDADGTARVREEASPARAASTSKA